METGNWIALAGVLVTVVGGIGGYLISRQRDLQRTAAKKRNRREKAVQKARQALIDLEAAEADFRSHWNDPTSTDSREATAVLKVRLSEVVKAMQTADAPTQDVSALSHLLEGQTLLLTLLGRNTRVGTTPWTHEAGEEQAWVEYVSNGALDVLKDYVPDDERVNQVLEPGAGSFPVVDVDDSFYEELGVPYYQSSEIVALGVEPDETLITEAEERWLRGDPDSRPTTKELVRYKIELEHTAAFLMRANIVNVDRQSLGWDGMERHTAQSMWSLIANRLSSEVSSALDQALRPE